jgi:hypothetical protein
MILNKPTKLDIYIHYYDCHFEFIHLFYIQKFIYEYLNINLEKKP